MAGQAVVVVVVGRAVVAGRAVVGWVLRLVACSELRMTCADALSRYLPGSP